MDGEPTAENPHPTLNFGYPKFEKRLQAILGKKRKTRTSADGISSPQNLSKQNQNENIPGIADKKDQLEIVGSNNNIFVPKNTVSCDKLGDAISTIDLKLPTKLITNMLVSIFQHHKNKVNKRKIFIAFSNKSAIKKLNI